MATYTLRDRRNLADEIALSDAAVGALVGDVEALTSGTSITWANEFAATLTLDHPVTGFKPSMDLAGSSATAIVQVTQGSTGGTMAYDASVNWPGGVAGTLSTGTGDVDVITFVTFDGGTTWNAVMQNNFS